MWNLVVVGGVGDWDEEGERYLGRAGRKCGGLMVTRKGEMVPVAGRKEEGRSKRDAIMQKRSGVRARAEWQKDKFTKTRKKKTPGKV